MPLAKEQRPRAVGERRPAVGRVDIREWVGAVRVQQQAHEPAAGTQDARRLFDGEQRIGGELQHLVLDDDVGAVVGQWEHQRVGFDDVDAGQVRVFQVGGHGGGGLGGPVRRGAVFVELPGDPPGACASAPRVAREGRRGGRPLCCGLALDLAGRAAG
ncbi:hypothetical protein GZL_00143 [Streptomyces sp. 769]|nr:hypothetical protein GZL_00143 [Streptomyces sp. 769]